MRVLHPAHRWSSVVCSAGIIIFMIMPVVCSGIFLIIMSCIFYMMTVYSITVVIISWGFFVFSPPEPRWLSCCPSSFLARPAWTTS